MFWPNYCNSPLFDLLLLSFLPTLHWTQSLFSPKRIQIDYPTTYHTSKILKCQLVSIISELIYIVKYEAKSLRKMHYWGSCKNTGNNNSIFHYAFTDPLSDHFISDFKVNNECVYIFMRETKVLPPKICLLVHWFWVGY